MPSAKSSLADLLKGLGVTDRTVLRTAPALAAELWQELLRGYTVDPIALLERKRSPRRSADVVLIRDIAFHSVCSHHLVPFFGRVHVAYVPNRMQVGLGTIARVVDALAHRLQLQEDLGQQIAEVIRKGLVSKDVCVMIEADHLCLQIRGARKTTARTTTIAGIGRYATAGAARREFLSLIKS